MRLTEKLSEDLPIYFAKDGKDEEETNTKSIIQKLGQLEDIEDELGIDLITLFKALKNHIYVKYQGKIEYVIIEGNVVMYPNRFTILHLINRRIEEEHDYYFKDYGQTWALTKEEL